ncbi:BA75_01108T0 [Komagataella pastoris]|uniref:BA75_01108T0 n=1 Tax=Komagataella pastoris TaxID=4922 RepID=A0A1B2J8L4_PICPA|nr:BA75_01108T0 [Komagataella pastoris]
MTLYKLTKGTTSRIIESSAFNVSIKRNLANRDFILHADLIQLYQYSQASEPLLNMLKGSYMIDLCKIRYHNKILQRLPKTDMFLETMKELRVKQLDREYALLVNSTSCSDHSELSFSEMQKSIKHQTTTIFNIIVSVLSVAFAAWYWSEHSKYVNNKVFRTTLSLLLALLVLVAEVVVYNSYLHKIEEAKLKEKKKKEIKRVIRSTVIS